MKKLLFLFLTITLLGCAVSLDDAAPNVSGERLIGEWKLVDYLADPGYGPSTYQSAAGRFSETIEFRADGRFVATTDFGLSQAQQFEYYKVLDNERLEMIYKTSAAAQPTHVWKYSDLTATSLTLSYGCNDPCNGRYARVK